LTSYGTSGTSYNATVGQAGTPAHVVKSGFVTVSGAGQAFNMSPVSGSTMSYTNTYVSGSADMVITAGATFTTKGTVVLD